MDLEIIYIYIDI